MREEGLGDAPLLGQALQELDRESQLARLVLPPLSQADTARLVRALVRGGQRAGDDALVEQVWVVSDGNPFAIVETMRGLHETPPETVEGVRLPRRVREMIDARLRRLGDRSRRLAAAVAVAGGEASFSLLQRLTGLDGRETAEAVEELVRRRVFDALGDGFDFDFTHDRIRSAVYESLPPETRQRLHAGLGEALESLHADRLDEIADRLAFHFARAERADEAVTYLTRFADGAARRYALDEAARALQEAQTLAERLPEAERSRRLLDVVLRRANCLYLLGRSRELFELMESHQGRFEPLADPALLAPFHFWHAYAYGNVGDQARAMQLQERAIEAATQCGDEATLGKAHSGLARECFWAGRFAQAIEHGREAVRCSLGPASAGGSATPTGRSGSATPSGATSPPRSRPRCRPGRSAPRSAIPGSRATRPGRPAGSGASWASTRPRSRPAASPWPSRRMPSTRRSVSATSGRSARRRGMPTRQPRTCGTRSSG